MATYNLIKKSNASTGQKIIPTKEQIRIGNLENRINDQEKKLDKIIELLQNGNKLSNADKQSS